MLSPPPGPRAMSGSILVVTTWERGTPGIQGVEARAAAKHSAMHRATKAYLPITSIMLRLRNPALI